LGTPVVVEAVGTMAAGGCGAATSVEPSGTTVGVGVVVVVVVVLVVVGSGSAAGRVRAKKKFCCRVRTVTKAVMTDVMMVMTVGEMLE